MLPLRVWTDPLRVQPRARRVVHVQGSKLPEPPEESPLVSEVVLDHANDDHLSLIIPKKKAELPETRVNWQPEFRFCNRIVVRSDLLHLQAMFQAPFTSIKRTHLRALLE